jgi:hypothetical protein
MLWVEKSRCSYQTKLRKTQTCIYTLFFCNSTQTKQSRQLFSQVLVIFDGQIPHLIFDLQFTKSASSRPHPQAQMAINCSEPRNDLTLGRGKDKEVVAVRRGG